MRFAALVPTGSTVLDLAAGGGRHSRLFLERGCTVVAIDRDASPLAALAVEAGATVIEADLEGDRAAFAGGGALAGRIFDAVVVVNYLYRPMMGLLIDAVAPGGVLIYETFALGNEAYGKPSNPDFLLRPGELLEIVLGGLRVVAFEEGIIAAPRQAVVQRICAVKSGKNAAVLLP